MKPGNLQRSLSLDSLSSSNNHEKPFRVVSNLVHSYKRWQSYPRDLCKASRSVKLEKRIDPDLFTVKETKSSWTYKYPQSGNTNISLHVICAKVSKTTGILNFDIQAGGDRKTLGSGKDMFYGLMRRLKRDRIQVKQIKGCWLSFEKSINYETYRKLTSGPTPMTPKEAAFSTWTGQRAREFGYTQIKKIRESNSASIYVRFSLPDNAPT